MADLNGQVNQSAAPGALLRTVAEAQQNDPTKTQAPSAQPNSPIRNLQQNPIESTIPSTTPRVLNVTPAQQPNPDFTGLHAMLSAAPVPPPHVAAQLIRAMMTPPAGGVVAPRPYVAPAAASSAPQGNASAPSNPGNQGVQSTTPSVARPAGGNGSSSSVRGIGVPVTGNFNQNSTFGNPGSYRSAPSGSMQPQTHANTIGGNIFLPGTIGTGGAGLLRGLMNFLTSNFGKLANVAEENAPAAESFLEQLPAEIPIP